MANKRMFNMKIVDSDAFLDMPLSTQALYFHLNMRADDDGFVGNPKKIMRMIGSNDDELKTLILKRFLLVFEDGVIVIKHWRMHNTIRKDRYTQTAYIEELNQLKLKDNNSYTLCEGEIISETQCIPNGNQMATVGKPNGNPDIGLDIDIDLDIDKDINTYAQSDKITHEPTPVEPSIITITLNDKSEFPIYQNMIDDWSELYPNVDVMQELRNMKGWCNSNPTKRKTKRGVLRFINGWLSREQDKPKFNKQKNQNNQMFSDDFPF